LVKTFPGAGVNSVPILSSNDKGQADGRTVCSHWANSFLFSILFPQLFFDIFSGVCIFPILTSIYLWKPVAS